MSAPMMPETFASVDQGPGLMTGLRKRQQCELVRSSLSLEQGTWRSHWQDLNDYILPRRGRFYITDVNKGDRRNQKIIDSTATSSARVLSAGMMAGVTSPAREWFRLTTGDTTLDGQHDVQLWLNEVQRRMELVFLRSNVYNKLPILYGDMGVFGTAAMAIMEDDEAVIRCYDFPVGTYYFANDDKMRVRTFLRTFRMTVDQVVMKWGQIDEQTGRPNFAGGQPSTISINVQHLWKAGQRNAWVDLVHVVQPNLAFDGRKIDSRYKRYEQIYYEIGSSQIQTDTLANGLLEHTGYDEFPILAARWETNSEDVYATNCPGMTALGDIKQLQTHEKRLSQAVEKMINPPMMGPSVLRTAKTSLIPGDITYVDIREGMQGFRPVHEVRFGEAMRPLEEKSQQIRLRIQRAFYEDLFLMLSQSDRREITAREIDERHEEKLLALGPMLEQLNQDVLDPLIDRTFNIMARKGLIPPAPPSLQGMALHPEYVSVMAQAQKQIGLAAIERTAGFFGQVGQYNPEILDVLDVDEMGRMYADNAGVSPKMVKDAAAVAQVRDARAKAQQAQQAAATMPAMAGAAKDLSQSPTSGDNALAVLLGRTRARKTINSTATPPNPVV